MHDRLSVIVVAILLAVVVSRADAQGAGSPSARATLRNDVGIELLGKAAIYSFYYQRMVTTGLGLEAGLGALGGGSSTDNTLLVFVPVGAKAYLIPRDGSLFLTGGAVLASSVVNEGPFDGDASDFYGYVGLGFEFRSKGGFLFRAAAYGLFAEGAYFIWPGVTFGYAF
jgi:hypothetical protein